MTVKSSEDNPGISRVMTTELGKSNIDMQLDKAAVTEFVGKCGVVALLSKE